jgi:phosphatidylglycerophosphate synthase
MSVDKEPKLFSKRWLESLPSPIRWGFVPLVFAFALFCFEILLSLFQIYSDLFGGDGSMNEYARILMIVALSVFLLAFIVTASYSCFAIIVLWRKRTQDNTSQRISRLESGISEMKREVRRIRRTQKPKKGK